MSQTPMSVDSSWIVLSSIGSTGAEVSVLMSVSIDGGVVDVGVTCES